MLIGIGGRERTEAELRALLDASGFRVSRIVPIALETVPGIGVIGATAIASTVTDPSVFKSGRDFAAWIGLVPRQHSTGSGKSIVVVLLAKWILENKPNARVPKLILLRTLAAAIKARWICEQAHQQLKESA